MYVYVCIIIYPEYDYPLERSAIPSHRPLGTREDTAADFELTHVPMSMFPPTVTEASESIYVMSCYVVCMYVSVYSRLGSLRLE